MGKDKSNSKNPPADRGKIILLAVLILAVLGTAAFLYFSSGDNQDYSDTAVLTDSGPDLFRLPGDFEPQEFLFLAGGPLADSHPGFLTHLVRGLGTSVAIRLLADPSSKGSRLGTIMNDGGFAHHDLEVVPLPIRTMWIRDFGPRTVTDDQGRRSMVEFEHQDGRGHRLDHDISASLSVALEMNLMGSRLSLEGGDLMGNGRGFGLVSEKVVARNSSSLGFGSDEILQNVASILGIENLTLVPPLEGEPTGHVDMYCTFLTPDLVVIGKFEKSADPENADRLDATADFLDGLATRAGRLRVERLPMPDHDDGQWRTYTAIVFANEVVLVPQFPDYCPDLDDKVMEFYRKHLPGRRIVGIDVTDLVADNTTLRSLTLNVPASRPAVADPEQPTP